MNKEEFKNLFDTYFNSVRSYLFYRGADREQASDLAQDVFLRLWEKQMEIDTKTAVGLLYKIANDMFISKMRRKKLELNYLNSLQPNFESTSDNQIDYKEVYAKFTKALARLSEKQRTVFLMAKMDGMKYQEIADKLNLSVKAIEKRMSATLAYLKKALKTE